MRSVESVRLSAKAVPVPAAMDARMARLAASGKAEGKWKTDAVRAVSAERMRVQTWSWKPGAGDGSWRHVRSVEASGSRGVGSFMAGDTPGRGKTLGEYFGGRAGVDEKRIRPGESKGRRKKAALGVARLWEAGVSGKRLRGFDGGAFDELAGGVFEGPLLSAELDHDGLGGFGGDGDGVVARDGADFAGFERAAEEDGAG